MSEEHKNAKPDSAFIPNIGVYVFFAVLAALLITLVIASNVVKPETPNSAAETSVLKPEQDKPAD